jgi:hypothetical protein
MRAADLAGRAARIVGEKLQSSGTCAAEPMNFQDNAAGLALLDAKNSPRKAEVFGPEMEDWLFRFAVNFEMKRCKVGEPFAVFANFPATGGRKGAYCVAKLRPIFRGHFDRHLPTV